MLDDISQESLYSITPDEQIKAINTRRSVRNRIRRMLSENLESRKEIRKQLAKAEADMEQAIGGELQTDLIDSESLMIEKPGEPVTNEVIKDRRKEAVWAGAVRALKAGGGRMSNMQLSSLLGLSSHGLTGLLEDCPFLRKKHDGRQGNEVTHWEIIE